ncbi:MAG: PaaI family thioesterase [bacterium]|nr:PaaI family thioesterase [bacterium]
MDQTKDGGVSCEIDPHPLLQSYPDQLHGGVVSLLLDGIMTNCLFSAGVRAVTARLEVRYLHPADIDSPVRLSARVVSSRSTLHFLEAELSQGDRVKAKGKATFMEQ